MLRMLYPIYGKQVYTWGFVRWGRLAKEIQNYEKECVDFLLTSLVVWVLCKARCKCVFQKVKQNVVELVKEIW